jgi:hypothetical protein
LASSLSPDQLRQLARHGAAARIQELEAEIAAIRASFPDLSGARRPRRGRRPGRPAAAAPAASAAQRKRRTMSPAERRAVSLRMKKYWAARRAQKTKGKDAKS